MFKLLTFFIALVTFSFCSLGQITIVIDPGHGGKDPGHEAHNKKLLSEKDLNLKISLLLGGYIEKYMENVKVVYTRTTDVFLSLQDRVEKANGINADYFLSIHCNGNERKVTRGTESHVHSFELKTSVALAMEIEKQFANRAGRVSRGVKDGNDRAHSLQVLKFTKMTSVLIECGFLTNEVEANYLNTIEGQEIIASAIFRGFRSYTVKEHPKISFTKSKKSESEHYTIQFMSSKTWVDTDSKKFKKLPSPISRIQLNTISEYKYIYTCGEFTSKTEAEKILKEVQESGNRDAFITKR
jgi:N-acetylmuramoyl-L-alanine amidase